MIRMWDLPIWQLDAEEGQDLEDMERTKTVTVTVFLEIGIGMRLMTWWNGVV